MALSQSNTQRKNYPTPEELETLGSLGQAIKAHWKQFRPTMYHELAKQGNLDREALAQEQQIHEKMSRLLLKEKLPYDQAWELVQAETFPPGEEDVPELGAHQP